MTSIASQRGASNRLDADSTFPDAEYATIRTEAAVQLPADADPVQTAPLMCAGVTMFNSFRNMNIPTGDLVAVQGLGGLGHLGMQYLSKMGYNTVALSGSGSKRALATKLGAKHYIDSSKENTVEALQKLGGAACIICTAPHPDIVSTLVDGLADRGTLLILTRTYKSRVHLSQCRQSLIAF